MTIDELLNIDGYDAAAKLRAFLIILPSRSHYPEEVNMMTDERETMSTIIPTMDEIHRDMMRYIMREDVHHACVNGGMKYRLVASAMREKIPMSGNTNGDRVGWKWDAFIHLMLLPPSDPLYNFNGTDLSIQFHTIVLMSPTLIDTAYCLSSISFGW